MQSFFDWFRDQAGASHSPWLVLGKGPSFSRRSAFDLSGFRTLSLNHVVRELPVDVAHAIDLEVVWACADAIESNASHVVLPWIPHVGHRPGDRTLAEWSRAVPVLRRLRERGRLLWYNASSSPRHRPGSPVVPVAFFSAEAALNLLALAGARRVRSLGVDGGTSYGREFADLKGHTLLANGQPSFDRQFQKLADTIFRTGVDFAPLDVEAPVRVYVGATEAQALPTKVLEYSLRRRASLSVRVESLSGTEIPIPEPRDPRNRPRTPFSFQRFLIPRVAGYRGRALYLDSDMQVFRDVRSLWTVPFDGAAILGVRGAPDGRAQFAVMLLDCSVLRWNIETIVAALDRGELRYEDLMNEMALGDRVRAGIDSCWNHLDTYVPGETALLHYTDMPRQPWLAAGHPWGHLWVDELRRALADRFLDAVFVEEQVRRGFVRPSLVDELERDPGERVPSPELLRRRDAGFVPPHLAQASAA